MTDPEPKMTDAEVNKLAVELVTNQVFMSDRLRRVEDVRMCFLPLAMVSKEVIEGFVKDQIAHFYEYITEALPRSANGMPIFASCRPINITDYKRVIAEETRIRKAMEPPCPPASNSTTSSSSAPTTPPSPSPSTPPSPSPSSKGSG